MNLVYLFSWTRLDRHYYGVRYAESATVESIGTTYWSSSSYVKAFIDANGFPDVVQVRRIFSTKTAAKRWEETVLRRLAAISSSRWLNRANNNAFKGAVMDSTTRSAISASRTGKPMGVFYTDGIVNVRSVTGDVPAGFIRGFTPSPKQRAHYVKLNADMSAETRTVIGSKAAAKTRGVAKPAGHGAKVSLANTGKKRPGQVGDLNPARRPEIRAKISANRWGRHAAQRPV